ncbi:type VI secretion system protein TssL [Glaciimonas sp. GS1]|uniref:Type VI secretion system protein TssL n=2 Tax=Glaciimonas soli TaxID=2590999 RepID=A0A843YWP5_9BURK|nr:type VI secretion system protein TssL [Glaciimonas soli]
MRTVEQTTVVAADEEQTAKLAASDAATVKARLKQIYNAASETSANQLIRLEQIKAARNPLLEAAEPLLLALAQMPKSLDGAVPIEAFRELLYREVINFQMLAHKAQVRREDVATASFLLCTALDEAASRTNWGGGTENDPGAWSTGMLAQKVHGDLQGGTKFFLIAGRLAERPDEFHDMLELMYYILNLGFKGEYSVAVDSKERLEAIRHDLYALISAKRDPVAPALSSHWRGVGAEKFKLLRSVPVWVSATVLGLGVLGIFGWYKYQLTTQSDQLVTTINAIGKMTPPPVQAVSLKLAQLLKNEIALGLVTVDENDSRSDVIFKGDDMFVAGQAKVNQKMLPLLNKVAAEVGKVSGAVQVIGHSDNQPIKTRQFPSNQVLSEERAASVGDVLQTGGVPADRLEIIGRGDSEPVASNANAAGRAKNRRVEIIVTPGTAAATKSAVPVSALSSGLPQSSAASLGAATLKR